MLTLEAVEAALARIVVSILAAPAENDDVGGAAHSLRKSVAAALAPSRVTTEMCLAVSVVSLAVAMAGTGDVATLRLIRSIRRRCDRGVSYGEYDPCL